MIPICQFLNLVKLKHDARSCHTESKLEMIEFLLPMSLASSGTLWNFNASRGRPITLQQLTKLVVGVKKSALFLAIYPLCLRHKLSWKAKHMDALESILFPMRKLKRERERERKKERKRERERERDGKVHLQAVGCLLQELARLCMAFCPPTT